MRITGTLCVLLMSSLQPTYQNMLVTKSTCDSTWKHTWPLLSQGEVWENQWACCKLPFSQWQNRLSVSSLTFPFLLKTLGPAYIVPQMSPGRVYFVQNNLLIYTCLQLSWLLHTATTLNFLENISHKVLRSHLCFLLIFFFLGKS